MPWKANEEGVLEIDEASGNPIWIDGENEMPVDWERSHRKINELNSESAGRRKQIAELESRLRVLDGIDDPDEWIGRAREAIEKVSALDESQLVDAGRVEKLKEEWKKVYEGKLQEKDRAINEAREALTAKEREVSNYMVGREFAASEYLKANTYLTPDIAQASFGKHFQVKDGQVVGYWEDGNPIYSPTRPGEVATFEEAVELIVDKYPRKNDILRSKAGSGYGTESNNGSRGTSKWGHIKTVKDFRDVSERTAFISEQGLDAFKKLPAAPN